MIATEAQSWNLQKNRRRSHGETVTVERGECSAVEIDIAAGIEVPNIDDDDDDDDDASGGAFSSKGNAVL